MQKWEYMTLSVAGNRVGTVVLINGREQGIGAPLHEFLNGAGQEGWEVMSMCPVAREMEYQLIILKRPKP